MFRTVPPSRIRSFLLYTQQRYMSYRFADTKLSALCMSYSFADSLLAARKLSANLYDIYHCCVYSEILLMMNEGIVRNMHSFIPKINLRN